MKKLLFFLLRAGVSAGILYFIFTRPDLNFRKMVETIGQIHRPSLYSASLAYGVVLLLGCLRWRVLLEAHNIKLGFARVVKLFFIGFFFNNFLPSLTGGDIVKAYYVSKETARRAEAATTVIVDRVIGLLALFFLGGVAAVTRLGAVEIRKPALATLIFLFLVFLLMGLAFSRRFQKRIAISENPSTRKGRLANVVKKVYLAFHYYRNCPGALAMAFILSLSLQTIMILINYWLALGLGVRGIGLSTFFVLIPLAGAISAIPITVAGWGLGEGAYKFCFAFAGLPARTSVSLSILLRLLMVSWSIIGLPLYLLHRAGRGKR